MATQTIILEVDEMRATDLVEALSKRAYIHVVTLDRHERKQRKYCPCCNRKFSKEMIYSVSEHLLVCLLAMLEKHKIAKSLVILNKKTSKRRLPPAEMERAVEFGYLLFERAKYLGLVQQFMDGNRETYHLTSAALSFLNKRKPLTPGTVVVLDSKVVDSFGEIDIVDVRFKDKVHRERVLRQIEQAVTELPPEVFQFIERGQMSLM